MAEWDGGVPQVKKIVGMGAPEEFVGTLEELVNTHHAKVQVDVIRAYHFGARFIVEVSKDACLLAWTWKP